MSSYMKFYITGKSWNEKEFQPVESFISNVIRDNVRNGNISSEYSCDSEEAERLIKEKIRSGFDCSDDR